MKKRIMSLLCVLALCLGLLPATALAAAPNGQVIYVGNENVTSGGYWTTDSDGNVTAYTGEGTPADNFIHYDAGNNVLTLHNATIKESLDYTDSNGDSSFINSSAIGVLNQHGNAELTIQLEGSNTIAEVSQGIYVLAHSQSTGSSSLTITGNGSLDTSGSQFCIRVQSNSSDAALSIENAKVTATVVDGYGGNGVFVQSSENSSVSLTVNSGSLTATGRYAYDAGILLQFGSGGSGSGTPTVTVSGNAVVDAKNGGIANNSSSPIQYKTGNDGTGGIVWNGSEGTVYGEATLQEDITIGEGESLTLGDGANLNTGSHEVIVDGGTLTGGDKITGTVKYAPVITTASLPDGTVGESYSETSLKATGDVPVTWSVSNGYLPAGLSLSEDGKISGTPTAEGTSTFTVTATNSSGSDSKEFTLKIEKPAFIPVTGLKLNSESLTLQENVSDTLTATVEPADATNKAVTWASSDNNIATVSEDGTVTAINAGTATITATAADGSGISASCNLTVTHGNMIQTPKKDATCTVDGTEEYWTCEICGKHYKDESGTIPTTPEENVIKATGHSYENGKCTVCGAIASDFKAVITAGANGTWQKGTKDGLSFTSNAAYKHFQKVQVDGKNLDASNYTVKEGSTIVTLKASYLETLSVGKHTLSIVSDTGTATTEFTIKAAVSANDQKPENPNNTAKGEATESVQTGDNINMMLWIVMLFVSASILGIAVYEKRKNI